MTYTCSSTSTCNPKDLGPSLGEMCGASTFVVFMSLLEELIRSNNKISGICERVKPIETPDEEYDFVVIGGGAGGAVAAGRLSENPDWKVLILEAGPDEPVSAGVPLFTGNLLRSAVEWNFTTTNESHACLATQGSCSLSSAKMLGGGTSHNSMIYLRGNPTDYNNWAALGNEGWSWREVKPFFLMAEDNGEIERVGRFYHGTGGLLSVERFPYVPNFGESVLAASSEIGYGLSEDLNGRKLTGFSVVQTTSKNGVRRSSASAYLRPVRNRKNLHVSLNSLATRVIIENGRAVGVEYHKGDRLKTVRASREVIVSAGAVKSPQILLLSGIGPKKHLKSVGVKLVKDLPGVGENYHDHVGYVIGFTINETDTYDNDWAAATKYLINQTGPWSSNGLKSLLGVFNSEAASPDFPDFQIQFNGYAASCAPGEIGALQSAGRRSIGMHAVNIRPKSRGRISLSSNDPFEHPVIWANYLSHSNDVDILVHAIESALAMADTQALLAHNITLSDTPLKACSNYTFPSAEYWACAISQSQVSNYHMAGTCKMGPSSDPMAVVDPRLRVYGIKGLRVADASIMPQVTSANTAAPSMMFGERAADFIKKDWARKSDRKTSSQCHLI